ncbi:hypothetical protein RND71_027000 [Anisodus tanguticus]|uniref:Uncharacterized protein n=1 Tax=Anisodus tanguticus TaxID=243964 RepID=A0AAE1V8T3_9SOLA|nr:hypothetical protein RND71_027000 [Anisodus tanguticus]
MDETGVHSLLNARKPIVSGIDTTSPVQTIVGKDSSNPFMAVTLPKSEHEEATSSKTRRKLPQTLTGSTPRARSRQTRKISQINIEKVIKDTLEQLFREKESSQKFTEQNPIPVPQNTERNNEDIDHVSETSSDQSDYAQDAQDPNDAYDSGMSFDSVARHNLDT